MNLDRAVGWVVAGVGLFLVGFGVWAFVGPESFYLRVAPFPPYNRHFIHDIGAFQTGLGVVVLMCLIRSDALLVALTGSSVGFVLHFFGHLLDRDLGGRPATDLPSLGLLAVVVVLTAVWRARTVGRLTPGAGRVPGVPPSSPPDQDVS